MAAGVAIFGLVPGLKALRRRLRLRRLSDGDVAAAWQEIVDRLSDLGDAPPRSSTPAEIARGTDPVMRPLADVYGESAYGPTATLTEDRVVTAREALEDTEDRLSSRYSRARRLWSRYNLNSLTPGWWRRRRKRRRG